MAGRSKNNKQMNEQELKDKDSVSEADEVIFDNPDKNIEDFASSIPETLPVLPLTPPDEAMRP